MPPSGVASISSLRGVGGFGEKVHWRIASRGGSPSRAKMVLDS
jgi:hypothetical protein